MMPSPPTNKSALPVVSVIIPTYNRKDSLLRTLDSLSHQTYPVERFEVIVVDDGSSDGTEQIVQIIFPFDLRYFKQANAGDAHARNRGAQEARGDILQFLDDDIIVEDGFLTAVVNQHSRQKKIMVVSSLFPLPSATLSPFERTIITSHKQSAYNSRKIEFTEILSGVLSLKQEHYFALGMMQPIVSSGSSLWCDVEFSYRAHGQGFSLWYAADAVAYHDDYALRDIHITCERAKRAAAAGAELFQRHPELKAYLPMFHDKDPIDWHQDSLRLVLRKLARRLLSSKSVIWTMEWVVSLLENNAPKSMGLVFLYRWIVSGYIYKGYKDGLREQRLKSIAFCKR